MKDEHWINKKWRPAMGWMYMVVCCFDMILFPILWAAIQSYQHQMLTQWNPLTLQGAGLFHIAMGAILGITAFGRTQEKLAGANTPREFVSTGGSSSNIYAPRPEFKLTSYMSAAPSSSYGEPSSRNTRND